MSATHAIPTLEELERQEAALVLSEFTPDTAWELGSALYRAAKAQAAPVVIDIRSSDRTYFHAALPGSVPDNDDWARRKGAVVLKKHRSSLAVGLELDTAGDTVGTHLGMEPRDFAAHGGGFPVRVANVGVVAAIVVSGLASEDDHALIVEVLKAHVETHRDAGA